MLPLRGAAANPGEPPPPSSSSTPSPGLSRPRLVKQRKHGASARAKPVSAAASAAAFNPFMIGCEDSGFRSGLSSDSGRGFVAGAPGDGRGDVFLFGSGTMKRSDDALREGMRKLWISEQNEVDLHGSSISIPMEEMRKINIGDGDNNSNGKSDDPKDDRGVFVFGQIPQETRKMDSMAVSGNAESAGNSRSDRLDAEVVALDMRRMNLGGCVGDAGGEHVFVFGSGKSTMTASMCDAQDLLQKLKGGDIASKLPEDLEKLRIGRAGEDVGFGKKRGDDDSESKVKGDVMFVFGSGKSYGSTYVGNVGNALPVVSESNSGSIDSRLPEDMKKLDIGSSGSDADAEKMTGDSYIGSKLERQRTFVFGSNKNSGNSFEAKATNILRGKFKVNVGPHGENMVSIPEEILKSNLEIPGCDADIEMKRGNDRVSSKLESEFVFGSGKKVADPFANDSVNTFPHDIKNLNIGAIPRTYSMKHSKNEMEGRNFTTASMSEKDHASKPMPGNFKNNIDLLNDMQRLRIGEFVANASGREIHDDKDHLSRGNKSSIFWNKARDNYGSVNEAIFKGLSGEMKQNTEKMMENMTGRSDKSFSGSEDINGNSTRNQFSFQAGSRVEFADNNINTSFSQNDTAKASYGPPTVGAGFSSVSSGFTFMTSGEDRNIHGADGGTILKNFSWTSRGVSPNIALNVSMGSSKDAKKNKRRNNLRQPASYNLKKDVASPREENNLQENFETGSTGSYSLMDFSPYEKVYDQCPGKPSVASDGSAPIDSHDSVGVTEESSYFKSMEDLVLKAQRMAINEFEMEDAELNDAMGVHNETSKDGVTSFLTDQNSESGPNSHQSASDINSATYGKQIFMENPIGSSTLDVEKQACDVGPSVKFSANDTNFSFAATSGALYSQGPSPALKQLNHRKNKSKMVQDSRKSNISSNFHLDFSSMDLFPSSMNLTNINTSEKPMLNIEVSSTSQTEKEQECATEKNPAANHTSILTASANDAVLETCEKWRLRGNQAYADGNVSKAEEYYTCGVDCVPPEGSTSDCKHALMLCYSNRAASRMSLGRMREALQDCSNAIAIDSCFLKAHVRAANCYLALGEAEDASRFLKKCCQLAGRDNRKILEEAADGLKKAQQVEDYICRCADLLKKRSTDDASNALLLILDAIQLSPYSERLIEMKADALFLLRRYEEVIKHCEQTMDSSKKNADVGSCEFFSSRPKDGLSDGAQFSYAEIWRWNLISKSYFYLGRLEEALSLFEKHNLVGLSLEKCSNKYLKSLLSFSATLQELVHQKAAGNNAFQASRHSEAIEHYTAALGCSTESRPYAAICFCNRAAAYQALGQVNDAIADCSLAIALDGAYAKAISRRATLHEKIRDYSQAINDLNRLILLLEKQMKDSFVESRKSDKSSCEANDLKRARQRLATLEDEARKGVPLDLYMILGVDPSSSAADIKKAYRKAALRHHPDKACQLLARSENTDDGFWKEVADEVHKDADRLFKMIGEAYAILSDRSKRLQYDTEEEMRATLKHESGYAAPKRADDSRSSYPEKSSYNRQSWNTRRPSGSSQQWWFESSRSSRQF